MRTRSVIAILLLWFAVFLVSYSSAVLFASEGGPFCGSDSYRSPYSCYDCQCVGHCYCMDEVGAQLCNYQGRVCWYANKTNIDGGPSNCHYICCREYNWDCELP